jgi:uncharacterized protein
MIVFGFAVGGLVGLTGMGGGSVMTPLLVLVFGINPVTAIGTDIAYSAVTKTVGGVKQLRQGSVDVSLSTQMALGSVPAAILAVVFLKAIERDVGKSFQTIVFSLLAGALLLTAAAVLARILLIPALASRERDSSALTRRERIGATALGATVGFVIGVTSAGSGALIGAGLILFFRLRPLRVLGTDIFHAAIVLWAASIAHMFAGDINYGLAATLLIGSVPGILLGSQLSLHAPTDALRLAMALVLVASGLGMLSKAGVALPTATLAIIPVVILAIIFIGLARRHVRARQAEPASTAVSRAS